MSALSIKYVMRRYVTESLICIQWGYFEWIGTLSVLFMHSMFPYPTIADF